MINSHETEIRGQWNVVAGKVMSDDNARRIEVLVTWRYRVAGSGAPETSRTLIPDT
jgi:hypothetical protein